MGVRAVLGRSRLFWPVLSAAAPAGATGVGVAAAVAAGDLDVSVEDVVVVAPVAAGALGCAGESVAAAGTAAVVVCVPATLEGSTAGLSSAQATASSSGSARVNGFNRFI